MKSAIMFAADTVPKLEQVGFHFIVHIVSGPSGDGDTTDYFTDAPQRFFIAALSPLLGKHSAQYRFSGSTSANFFATITCGSRFIS